MRETISQIGGKQNVLCNFARFHDSFELFHNQRPDPHFDARQSKTNLARFINTLTLFTNETVIPVVGVIRVTQTSVRVFELEELVSVLS